MPGENLTEQPSQSYKQMRPDRNEGTKMSNESKKDTMELNLEQLDKVSGGDNEREYEVSCGHISFYSLEQYKEKDGVQYLYVQCDNCGERMWKKLSDLFGSATELVKAKHL